MGVYGISMDTGVTRVCTGCGAELPLESYAWANKAKGYRKAECRDCVSARNRVGYLRNREERLKYAAQYRSENADKVRDWNKAWAERNPGYSTSQTARWRKENPARSREILHRRRLADGWDSYLSKAERDQIEATTSCAACGSEGKWRKADPGMLPVLHIDHIVPVAKGGTGAADNLQVLCDKCNLSKGSLTMDEWKQSGRPRAREVFGR